MVMSVVAPSNDTPQGAVLLKAQSVDDLVIAGYASVEMVDKQGDMITTGALNKAFGKFMAEPSYTNVQLAHSNIQVGNVIPSYTDSNGRVWKSEVDDTGLFVVIKLRNDIEKAREVASEIRKGNLRAFSIGGQAFKRVNKSDGMRGSYREIQDMELHEVTICEKGINTESTFRILKEDKTMAEEQVVEQLHNVLDRLSKRLEEDDKDKKLPPFMQDKKKEKKEENDEGKESMYNADDNQEHGDYAKGEDFADAISLDYLNWMEDTLKSAGVDVIEARHHFDALEKGYSPGEDGASHRGQPPLGIVGEGTTSPKANFGTGGRGNKFAIRASQDAWNPPQGNQFVLKENVSQSQLEEAYEVFKAAALEQNFKQELNEVFTERLQNEMMAKAQSEAAQSYDARVPVDRLEKALLELASRVDSINTDGVSGGEIRKSATPSIEIPSTEALATMDWAEVHNLAGQALGRGE